MTIYKRHCNNCGKYYEGRGRYYCSKECQMSSTDFKEKVSKSLKGHSNPNKGKRQVEFMSEESIEGSKRTRFKKGHIPYYKGKKVPKEKRGGAPRKRVNKICKTCGKKYEIKLSLSKRSKFCSKKCKDISMKGEGNPMHGKKRPDISKLNKKRWEDPKFKEEVSTKISQTRIERDIGKKLWKNPEWREMMVKVLRKGLQNHPNKREKQLGEILDRNFPHEFGYNGNCELGIMIGGLIPDFPNVNGEKKLIELFGDTYHDPDKAFMNVPWKRQEFGRKAIYSQLGYDCLVIWEHELKELPEEEIVKKIEVFKNV